MQYLCSLHDDDSPPPAVLSVMSVPTGETINVCQGCLPTWALIMAGVTPELIDQALTQLRALDEPTEQEGAAPGLSGTQSAEGQQARVSAELAARPDSASTSAAVVDFPQNLDVDPPRDDNGADFSAG